MPGGPRSVRTRRPRTVPVVHGQRRGADQCDLATQQVPQRQQFVEARHEATAPRVSRSCRTPALHGPVSGAASTELRSSNGRQPGQTAWRQSARPADTRCRSTARSSGARQASGGATTSTSRPDPVRRSRSRRRWARSRHAHGSRTRRHRDYPAPAPMVAPGPDRQPEHPREPDEARSPMAPPRSPTGGHADRTRDPAIVVDGGIRVDDGPGTDSVAALTTARQLNPVATTHRSIAKRLTASDITATLRDILVRRLPGRVVSPDCNAHAFTCCLISFRVVLPSIGTPARQSRVPSALRRPRPRIAHVKGPRAHGRVTGADRTKRFERVHRPMVATLRSPGNTQGNVWKCQVMKPLSSTAGCTLGCGPHGREGARRRRRGHGREAKEHRSVSRPDHAKDVAVMVSDCCLAAVACDCSKFLAATRSESPPRSWLQRRRRSTRLGYDRALRGHFSLQLRRGRRRGVTAGSSALLIALEFIIANDGRAGQVWCCRRPRRLLDVRPSLPAPNSRRAHRHIGQLHKMPSSCSAGRRLPGNHLHRRSVRACTAQLP
jgi:hypothetical protein